MAMLRAVSKADAVEDFGLWYPRDGRPGLSPAQPATVCVLRFPLDLSDWQVAEARCAAASISPWPWNWTISASTTVSWPISVNVSPRATAPTAPSAYGREIVTLCRSLRRGTARRVTGLLSGPA
ncbi:hypothetical protein ACH4UM_22290 [Streptomyces sp. NPDC020801]|uniref:hypothetical protein n=1 Tax=unclassified Streptomyces TaxID=2593676 RepID=UPI0037A95A8D